MLIAAALVAGKVALHAIGFSLLLRSLIKSHATPPTQAWPIAWLLIRVTWFLILIHVAEITVWSLFYWGSNCLPDAESAFCFAGVTYATTGYSDLVMPKPSRMLGPVESLTGIPMCGLSVGMFFGLVTRIYAPRFQTKPQQTYETTAHGNSP